MSTASKDHRTTSIPALARTIDECAVMKRDNVSRGDFWIITDGYSVTLAAQKVGESATGVASIPRDVFLRFVRWYLTGDADMRRGVSDDVVEAISSAIAKAEGQ